MRPFPYALRALALGALCAAAASATTVLPVDAPRAVDQAEMIFVGRVLAIETATSGDGKFPFTFVTFAVDQSLKGKAADQELTLRFLGGDLDESKETVEVVGMPSFELGDEVVLFVAGNGTAACPLVGWWQGKLDIVAHPSTGERLLVDHRGALLEGVGSRGWSYGDVRYDADEQSFTARSAGSELLWQDGVVIDEPVKARSAGEYTGVAADVVIADLRALIGARQSRKGFTAAAVVRSASPLDLPTSVSFTAVAPTE